MMQSRNPWKMALERSSRLECYYNELAAQMTKRSKILAASVGLVVILDLLNFPANWWLWGWIIGYGTLGSFYFYWRARKFRMLANRHLSHYLQIAPLLHKWDELAATLIRAEITKTQDLAAKYDWSPDFKLLDRIAREKTAFQ